MLSQVEIPVSELRLGMFVSELDRPWLDSPFLVQGFILTDPDQIAAIRDLCTSVTIDTGKSASRKKTATAGGGGGKFSFADEAPGKRQVKYQDTRAFDEEVAAATSVYEEYGRTVEKFYDQFQHDQKIDIKDIDGKIKGIVRSVIRNPDACLLLHEMRKKSDYLHDHAMGMTIRSAALARQLGFPERDIRTLALGAMMCDIGNIRIPSNILTRPTKLTESEYDYVKTHVKKSVEMLEQQDWISEDVLKIVACHHERYDGSGYPNGLSGSAIPIFARIVAVTDCYDAVISRRPYAAPITPSEAIRLLYSLRNRDFQSEIVEEFIQAVGLYPVGTIVELSSGEIGTVVGEYRRRRLRPKIMVLLDRDRRPVTGRQYINLIEETHDADGNEINIVRALEGGISGMQDDDIFS